VVVFYAIGHALDSPSFPCSKRTVGPRLRNRQHHLVLSDASDFGDWHFQSPPAAEAENGLNALVDFLANAGTDRILAGRIVRQMVDRLGSLSAVLTSDKADLIMWHPSHPDVASNISRFGRLIESGMKANAFSEPLYISEDRIKRYLRFKIGSKKYEVSMAIFFDKRFSYLHCCDISTGAKDNVIFPVDKIIKYALECNASYIIVAHNHPSGDSSPSNQDVRVTRHLIKCANLFDINIHDHFVVSCKDVTSIRDLNLI
jgi:DNA repair protein RadC